MLLKMTDILSSTWCLDCTHFETFNYECEKSSFENHLGILVNNRREYHKTWIDTKTIRLIFQNLLVEQNSDVLQLSITVYSRLLEEINKYNMDLDNLFVVQSLDLLTLTLTPIGIARLNFQMDTRLIMRPSGQMVGSLDEDEDSRRRRLKKRGRQQSQAQEPITVEDNGIPMEDLKINIDAPVYKGDVMLIGFENDCYSMCCC